MTTVLTGAQVGPSGSSPALDKVVIGDTTTAGYPASAVVVPSFATHADAVFTPVGALDDHFDTGTLNAKWAQTNAAGTNITFPTFQCANSCFCMGGMSFSTNNNIAYSHGIDTPLPNTDFTVSVKAECVGLVAFPQTSSLHYFDFQIYNNTSSVGTRITLESAYSPPGGTHALAHYVGAGTTISSIYFFLQQFPKYFRIKWTKSTGMVLVYYSIDGVVWQQFDYAATGVSGLSSTVVPQRLYFSNTYKNLGAGYTQIDWVKLTSP